MWWRRSIVLAAAILITVVTLGFWTFFAKVVGHYLSQPDHPQQQTANPNEVTVQIICTKSNPCPEKPKPHD